MDELITLTPETKSFKTKSGKTYHVAQSNELSVDYFLEWLNLQPQVAYGVDFSSIHGNLSRAYENMNKGKVADAAVIVHNILNGIDKNINKRTHPVLELAALFLIGEDEDRTKYDAEYMAVKIQDWKNTGVDITSFFQFAFSLVTGLSNELETISQSTSLQTVMEKVKNTQGSK